MQKGHLFGSRETGDMPMVRKPRTWLLVAALAILTMSRGSAEEQDQGTQLIDAARRGDLAAVQRLVAAGANVNASGHFHITALWQATSKGHQDVVEYLLKAGADPNRADGVWKSLPLMLADKDEIVGLLVQHGARGTEAKLRVAALSGSESLVKTILNAAELDAPTLASARAQAALAGHAKIVELFDQAAGKRLPDPPQLDAAALAALEGMYFSERLEEMEFSRRDGQLFFHTSGGGPRQLVPRDERTFDLGPYTFTFDVRDGKAISVSQTDPSSLRTFTRARATVSTPSTGLPTATWRPATTGPRFAGPMRVESRHDKTCPPNGISKKDRDCAGRRRSLDWPIRARWSGATKFL
jgi:hypothetical protein